MQFQILQHPELLNYTSLAEVAKTMGVSEATFIHFCRTLGVKGFSDFKMEFTIEQATLEHNSNNLLDSDISYNDEPDLVANKIQVAINNVIGETINLLDSAVLEQVVNELRLAKRIFIRYGIIRY